MTDAPVQSPYDVGRDKSALRAVLTPEGIPLHVHLAQRGDRATAFIADFVLIVVAVVLITVLSILASGSSTGWVWPFTLLAIFFLRAFYFTWFELRGQGQTPGKRWVGIRVMDARGGPLTADAIVARNLVRELELWMPLTLVLAHDVVWPAAPGWLRLAFCVWLLVFGLMPLFNSDRLRVGDMVAGTLVVRTPRTVLLPDMVDREVRRRKQVNGAYRFSDKQLDVYGIYELQVLEEVLRTRERTALRAVCDKIRRKIRWDATQGKVDPERFLSEYYAALRARLEKRMLLGKRKRDKHSDES